jgi:regulator of protease activity HflC (stomatin/prohibitin superfamily)
MTKINLFDTVKLTKDIYLLDGTIVAAATIGTVIEIYNNGEAYEVELFGNWVKYDEQGKFIPGEPEELNSFIQTIGVETVYPHQICLFKPANETVGVRAQLLAILDDLSDQSLAEVKNFAEFLKQKQH